MSFQRHLIYIGEIVSCPSLNRMRKSLLFAFLILSWFNPSAQSINPGTDAIFRTNELAIIKLTLSPEDKAFLLHPDNTDSEVYLPAVFQMINSQMDTILAKEVGVRLRGNTSREHNKKPFKIDFREFDGSKFYGYKKFNLKPNVNDPSQIREPLTLQFYREMNIPAARTHPLKLYMNDEYMGVYLNVEQIDDEFLNLRYGHEEGFLYKCGYSANLIDNGQVFNTSLFESEINEETDTRTELDHFVEILNTSSDANFPAAIEAVFNVESYLKQLAVEALLGHWDGYSYNMNNFYLFYNGQTEKVEFIPYDADNTWGIDWLGVDWGIRDLRQWANSGQARPLTKRILNVPAYRATYVQHLSSLVKNYFNEAYLNPILDSHKAMLSDAIESDTYFDDSFEFTHADFLNSFTTGMEGNHVDYGIIEYLHARMESAIEQLPELVTGFEENIENVSHIYPNPSLNSRTYLFTNSGVLNTPVVYSSTGSRISVNITAVDNHKWEISIPPQSPKGLYLIHVNQKVFRWVYK